MKRGLSPMKMVPCFKNYLWGGERLVNELGKNTTMRPIAESWEISCHPDAPSKIATGKYIGSTLSKVIESHPDYVAKGYSREFPVLIKLIDAKEGLSLQVHPNNAYANANENQQGKNEMWYVIDADSGAELIVGFKNEISKEKIKKRIADNTILEVANVIPVKAGDCFEIPAGMLHAIGGGILIAEVQQSSNVTYRVYDYDRKDKAGNPRELHIDKALEVLEPSLKANNLGIKEVIKKDGCDIIELTNWKWFNCRKYSIISSVELCADNESFHGILLIGGQLDLQYKDEKISLKKGDSIFIPAGMGKYKLTGKGEVLLTSI